MFLTEMNQLMGQHLLSYPALHINIPVPEDIRKEGIGCAFSISHHQVQIF